jgi:CDP-paratose 2-epimerase
VAAEGHDVVVFDNLSRVGCAINLNWLRQMRGITFRHGDVRFMGDVTACVRDARPDVVFHLAGQVAMTTSISDPYVDFHVNAVGTMHVLEAIRTHVPEATVVYSSTNKVYGDLGHIALREEATRYVCPDHPSGFEESIPLDFHSPYGCSKGAADQYMLDYHRIFGLRTLVFRHSSIYGGRQFSTYDQGWIGWFCSQAVRAQAGRGESFSISGNGKQVRDVLHVNDAVSLYLRAMDAPPSAHGQAFNVGGGMENSRSILELLGDLQDMLGVELRPYQIPPRISDQAVFVANNAKAKRLLGWAPRIACREGLASMVEWVRESEAAA